MYSIVFKPIGSKVQELYITMPNYDIQLFPW